MSSKAPDPRSQSKIQIRPAEISTGKFKVCRDPVTKKPLADNGGKGESKPDSVYWRRRLKDGGCVVVETEASKKAKVAREVAIAKATKIKEERAEKKAQDSNPPAKSAGKKTNSQPRKLGPN